MKDFEKIVKALECCSAEGNAPCDECPYKENNCRQKDRDARELILELKAQLEQPTTACDHEIIAQSHSEEIRKLNDKLGKAEIAHERTQRELHEAQKELTYLRAIKATAEAFLGVKIDGQM